MRMSLGEAAAVTGGSAHGPDVRFEGVSTDSRTLSTGELFVALRGPSFDGHRFLDAARARGAAAALIERTPCPLPAVVVPDARAALGRLAADWRARFAVDAVGVTGSNGKTTVKEMIASILAQDAPVLATRGNLNNEIGVPLTLARLGPEHRRIVVEMGANHAGEIAALAAWVAPRVGVITVVAPAHLEGFGSIEGVARAKGELIAALPEHGIAVVNADAGFMDLWRTLAGRRRLLRFGFGPDADVRVEHAPTGDGSALTLHTPAGEIDVALALAGRHNAANAAAAAAAALALDIPPGCIRAGLERVRAVRGRLEITSAPGGVRVIDDTYNANPQSLSAALEVLAQFPGTRVLVLGDMAELGPDAEAFHREAGLQARALGMDRLFTVGALAALAARSFGEGASHFESRDALVRSLVCTLDEATSVLVKGSRSAGMEAVVAAILEGEAECC